MALVPVPQLAYTDGSNPPMMSVGEYEETYIVQANAVTLTSGTAINLVTLNLLAGDWDISAAVNFGAGLLTLSNNVTIGTSLTTLTFNTDPRSGYLTDINRLSMVLPVTRQKIIVGNDPTVTTPVYLVLKTTFSLSTLTAWGYMRARRPI